MVGLFIIQINMKKRNTLKYFIFLNSVMTVPNPVLTIVSKSNYTNYFK